MVRHLEAVFEDGVLRPVEPLSLPQHQHVMVTIDDAPPVPASGERVGELTWLKTHGQGYIGQWVALEGNRLVAHGADARSVRDEARRLGVQVPLMHRPSGTEAEPQAFWI